MGCKQGAGACLMMDDVGIREPLVDKYSPNSRRFLYPFGWSVIVNCEQVVDYAGV